MEQGIHGVRLATHLHAHLHNAEYLMRVEIAYDQRIAADGAEIVATIRAAAIYHIAVRAIPQRALRKRWVKEIGRLSDEPLEAKE
jgi:hypothetical protein